MKKEFIFNKLFFLAVCFSCAAILSACADDDSAIKVGDIDEVAPNGEAIPDSVLYSDSLYSWYLERFNKEEEAKDSTRKNSSGTKDSKSSSSNLSSNSNPNSSSSSGTSSATSSSSEVEIDSALAEAAKVHLLPPAGFYNELAIPVPAALYGGTIRCTFNGSAPDVNSAEFVEPYVVTRNTPVRCAEFVGDSIARKSSHTFFINETVSMPVVAISVDSAFFREKYANTSDCFGQNPYSCRVDIMSDAEYPVHVEFFEEGSRSAKKAWQIDAGISLMGNWSRTYAKKPVSIKMKKEYEDGRLKYNLFSTRPEANKFKGFNLRNGGNRYVGDFVADAAMTSVVEGSSVDYQRSRQVVVFYNGVYMGIHDLRERLNEHFVETNHGIDSKSVDMVKHVKDTVTANGGTADSYIDMLNYIATNDFSGENNAAYKHVQTLLDVGNYADYMAAEIYLRNADWPSNNVRAWRSPDQPYRFVLFDVDQGFGWSWVSADFQTLRGTMFDWIRHDRSSGRTGPGYFANIFVKLRENPDFCRMFVNHGAVMLSSYLTYNRIVDAVNRVNSEIPLAEMERDLNNESVFQRRHSPYGTFPSGFDRTGSYVTSYAEKRTEATREEYRTEFGLGDDISVTISSNGKGRVLLDGMKLPSNNYTGAYFEGNAMLLTAVPEDGSSFVKWKDGSTENPRLVNPKNRDTFVAEFK
ncbi:MAG: CotH kinase family protein [Fibrobacter sp.]|nr:CotH kinase family protein [Fibrobacter sp.]